jgi:5'-nucleotidase (lipoprotein e(P4) family)
MNILRWGGSIGLCAVLSVSVWAEDTPSYTNKDLNEQMVMALTWVQSSAEYRELCYQAFNLAGMIVDKAVSQKSEKPLAIICDLDETLLDNSAYNAGMVGRDASFTNPTWQEWESAAQALAIPGAVDFLNDAAKKVEIFYVTNRDQVEGTLKNLKALKFPFADAEHLRVKTTTSNKQPRFDQITQDHHVVLYMGDNTNDLPLGSYGKAVKDRNALVDANKDKFGTEFVALPNPYYGDWEPAVTSGYYGLSAAGKSAARKSVFYSWVPPQ